MGFRYVYWGQEANWNHNRFSIALQAISESGINDIFDKHDEEKLLEKSDKTMFDLNVARGK